MEKFFNKLKLDGFKCKRVVIVAVSGGRDSVVLLDALYKMREQLNVEIKVANVEHGVRGSESKQDSEFVQKLAQRYGVEFLSKNVDAITYSKNHGVSLEDACRILRYEFFSELIEQKHGDCVAIAHHLNDDVETVLLNIFRGSGACGACGIAYERDYIIRPMLELSGDEIKDYAKENNLAFRTDKTNFDNAFTRNFLRNEIIPKLEERFPNFLGNVKRFKDSVLVDEEYFENLIKDKIVLSEKKATIKLEDLKDKAISKRLIKSALEKVGQKKDVFKIHYDMVYDFANGEKSNKILNLKNGYIAKRTYDSVEFFFDNDSQLKEYDNEEICFDDINLEKGKEKEIRFLNGKLNFEIVDSIAFVDNVTFIDKEKANGTVIRLKKEGDVFLRSCGKKTLGKYFNDKKIPHEERLFPLIAKENYVLAIIGRECGKELFVDENTKEIIKISYIKD